MTIIEKATKMRGAFHQVTDYLATSGMAAPARQMSRAAMMLDSLADKSAATLHDCFTDAIAKVR